eukprot:TRINITY_DN19751_c0_g1_i4.p2 TRINITY_DN19751_c0_g1~~TRINITY_DN19751_c0_g1_i4.p2  ORF type:complete len:129 (-),score=23.45 TRINITY_DN19751_c0_g1_i4:147-533(-)
MQQVIGFGEAAEALELRCEPSLVVLLFQHVVSIHARRLQSGQRIEGVEIVHRGGDAADELERGVARLHVGQALGRSQGDRPPSQRRHELLPISEPCFVEAELGASCGVHGVQIEPEHVLLPGTAIVWL